MPTGTVTFLFTDSEGSTALLAELGAAYREVVDDHARLLRATFAAHGAERSTTPATGSGPSDLPDRQRTLRATIDWSYQLLGGDERALFRRLGCFVGGCTIEAATAVVVPGEGTAFDVFDGLASLVEKSLLWPQRRKGGTTRFRMLETLREYDREQLDVDLDEATTTYLRHARYHLGWPSAPVRGWTPATRRC